MWFLLGEINFENIDKQKAFSHFKNVVQLKKSKNINIFSIDNVKVDFVNYSYPWLQNQLLFDGIRLAGIEDIAAMKLAAITGRGSRKDFIDLYFLIQELNLNELFDFYKNKYQDGSEYMVLKSLTYFDDAESDPEVEMIEKVRWVQVKRDILQAVNHYNQNL